MEARGVIIKTSNSYGHEKRNLIPTNKERHSYYILRRDPHAEGTLVNNHPWKWRKNDQKTS